MAGRFIKLYEQITKWEWYLNANTFKLFIHLLLKAQYEDSAFMGVPVKRGQLVTSLPRLSRETGLSVREVRTALDHLISTGELTALSYSKFRVITVVKYDDFQTSTGLSTGNRQASDRQSTGNRQHNRNNIERKEEKENIEGGREAPLPAPSTTAFIPPTKEEILDYCLENHYGINVDRFYANYSSKGWKVNGHQIEDWKALVQRWAAEDAQKGGSRSTGSSSVKQVIAQQYTQRDYGKEDDDAFARMMEGMKNEYAD